MTTRNALTSDPILPTIWRLSLPNMVAMVATAGVSIAETTYIVPIWLSVKTYNNWPTCWFYSRVALGLALA